MSKELVLECAFGIAEIINEPPDTGEITCSALIGMPKGKVGGCTRGSYL